MELLREVLRVGDDDGFGHPEADAQDGLAEELAVLGAADRLEACADELHAELGQRPVRREIACEVEGGLAAEGR